MKIGALAPLLAVLALSACGGDTDDAAAAPQLSADEQALAEISQYWETHYNMGHPGMVASVYAPDAWFLASNGALGAGPDEIAVLLAENAELSPQIEVTPGDQRVFGDEAVGWGTYTISLSPEGADPISYGGTYMTHSTKIDGEWKVAGHIGNLAADPFEGFEFSSPEGEPGPNDGTMGDLVAGYVTHFNLGHPSMVADYYSEGAMASFSRGGPNMGRAAISEALTGLMEAGKTTLDINDLSTLDLGDGWALDGGWFSQTAEGASDPYQAGGYLNLAHQAADGSWQIEWSVVNAWPIDGM